MEISDEVGNMFVESAKHDLSMWFWTEFETYDEATGFAVAWCSAIDKEEFIELVYGGEK